jgi:DUF1009 family protein
VSRFGLIAGNGRFPILALEAARENGDDVVVLAIQGEADPEVERLAEKTVWISIGELSKLVDTCRGEGIRQVMMAGQVKHASIFSGIRPDWRMAKLLFSLGTKNTESLIGGVVNVLRDEGIELVESTRLLTGLLADEGEMARRSSAAEREDLGYGRAIAGALASYDIGQAVAIADGACVAVEAMEGTDAMLRRAAGLVNGKPLRLVKSSRRRKHMLFDVPVAGPETIRVMIETGTTALAVDAGRTLLLDKRRMLAAAAEAKIAVVGYPAEGE